MKKAFSLTSAFALFACAAFGQLPNTGLPADDIFIKLFENVPGFTAKTDVQVLNKDQRQTMRAQMDFTWADKKMRVDVDVNQMKSAELTASGAASLKQLGMDRVISIVRPDKKTKYTVLPNMRAYVIEPLSKEKPGAETKSKTETTAQGNETVEGHPCVRNKVVITGENVEPQEALTWNASDLKGFPVRLQVTEKVDRPALASALGIQAGLISGGEETNTVIMTFKKIDFTKPDARQFEPPAGFTAYNGFLELMQPLMKKMLGTGSDTEAK